MSSLSPFLAVPSLYEPIMRFMRPLSNENQSKYIFFIETLPPKATWSPWFSTLSKSRLLVSLEPEPLKTKERVPALIKNRFMKDFERKSGMTSSSSPIQKQVTIFLWFSEMSRKVKKNRKMTFKKYQNCIARCILIVIVKGNQCGSEIQRIANLAIFQIASWMANREPIADCQTAN